MSNTKKLCWLLVVVLALGFLFGATAVNAQDIGFDTEQVEISTNFHNPSVSRTDSSVKVAWSHYMARIRFTGSCDTNVTAYVSWSWDPWVSINGENGPVYNEYHPEIAGETPGVSLTAGSYDARVDYPTGKYVQFDFDIFGCNVTVVSEEEAETGVYGAIGQIYCPFPGDYPQPIDYRYIGDKGEEFARNSVIYLVADENGLDFRLNPAYYDTDRDARWVIYFDDGSTREYWISGGAFYGWQPGDPDHNNINLDAHNYANEIAQDPNWIISPTGWCFEYMERGQGGGAQTTCIECPERKNLLVPGTFVRSHLNTIIGITNSGDVVEDEQALSLTDAGYECAIYTEHLIDGNLVYVTNGSTAFEIAVAINAAEGNEDVPYYLNRHMDQANIAIANFNANGHTGGWYSFVSLSQ